MSLTDMLRSASATIEEVAVHLDGLAPERRLAEARTLDRDAQRRLYRLAEKAAPLDLAYYVPASVPDVRPVRHFGLNTLPLPPRLKLFEKRFCRPAGRGEGLYGYNQSPFLHTVGPGFFVAIPTAGNPLWTPRGAVVVDYFQVPPRDAMLPPGWPRVRSNDTGVQQLVYGGTRDFMRRVSSHVSIGAAHKGEKALDHYFVLVREPLGDDA